MTQRETKRQKEIKRQKEFNQREKESEREGGRQNAETDMQTHARV